MCLHLAQQQSELLAEPVDHLAAYGRSGIFDGEFQRRKAAGRFVAQLVEADLPAAAGHFLLQNEEMIPLVHFLHFFFPPVEGHGRAASGAGDAFQICV